MIVTAPWQRVELPWQHVPVILDLKITRGTSQSSDVLRLNMNFVTDCARINFSFVANLLLIFACLWLVIQQK